MLALAATCRATAHLVAPELQLCNGTLTRKRQFSEVDSLPKGYAARKWVSDRPTVPTPDRSSSIVVQQSSDSLSLQIQGKSKVSFSLDGQLLGWPSWSFDSSHVAFPILRSPQDSAADPRLHIVVWGLVNGTHTCVDAGEGRTLQQVEWAPTAELLAVLTWFEGGLGKRCPCRVQVLAADGLSCSHLEPDTSRNAPAELVWSPDSQRLALIYSHGCLAVLHAATGVSVEISQPYSHAIMSIPSFLVHIPSWSYTDSPVAWAPSGPWLLCFFRQDYVSRLGFLHLDPSNAATGASSASLTHHSITGGSALTWGVLGVAVMAKSRLHLFKAVSGPGLEVLHTFRPIQGQLVMSPSFHWAPDGQWLVCLVRLLGESLRGAVRLILVHPASGCMQVVQDQPWGGAAPMTMRALTELPRSFQPRCVWAPDSASLWLGVAMLHSPSEVPARLDKIQEHLLCFK